MNVLKRILTGVGGITLVAVALQLVAPKAVHSTVAALVSVVGNVAVTNPTASGGGPQALVTQDLSDVPSAVVSGSAHCLFQPAFVCDSEFFGLGNEAFVVTDISGTCVSSVPITYIQFAYNYTTINIVANYVVIEGTYYYTFGRQTNVLVPAGTTFPPQLIASPSGIAAQGDCNMQVVGHAVSN